MKFKKKKADQYYQKLKENENFPESFLKELFLIGKLTSTETIKNEIQEILQNHFSLDIQKAFRSKNKIPSKGDYTDYEKSFSSLITYAHMSENLPVGEMFVLLGYDYICFNSQSLIKKINKFPHVLKSFNGMKSLRILDGDFNDCIIPEEIGQITSLETLEIEGNYKKVPDSIEQLSNLKEMKLHLTDVEILPESLSALKNLQKLIIGGNSLWGEQRNEKLQLPLWLNQLNISELEISGLIAKEIDANIFPSCLESLKVHDMSQLSSITESIGHLKHLQTFCLNLCPEISSLPLALSHICSLQCICLESLPNLKSVDSSLVNNNHIRSFKHDCHLKVQENNSKEETVYTSETLKIDNTLYLNYVFTHPELFPNVEYLELTGINVSTAKAGIGIFPKLKTLKCNELSGCSGFFDNIENCSGLEKFEIHTCGIRTFFSLGGLKKLRTFIICACDSLLIHSDQFPKNTNEITIQNGTSITFGDIPFSTKKLKIHDIDIYNIQKIEDILAVEVIDFNHINIILEEDFILKKMKRNQESPILKMEMANIKSNFIFGCKGISEIKKFTIDGSLLKPLSQPLNEIFDLPELEELTFENYQGDQLTEILGCFPQLKKLKLSKIKSIEQFPKLTLPSLEMLSMYNCDFSDFSNLQLPVIDSLSVESCDNFGKSAIEDISKWKTLHLLRIQTSGKLREIPECITTLDLRFLELNLDCNYIPEFIGKIKSLHTLCLDGFVVEELPVQLANLPGLRNLSLNDTFIKTKIADEFRNLKLRKLRMNSSKFAGINMKKEIYENLITEGYTRIGRSF